MDWCIPLKEPVRIWRHRSNVTVCFPDWLLALLIVALGGDWILRRINGWILRREPPTAEGDDADDPES